MRSFKVTFSCPWFLVVSLLKPPPTASAASQHQLNISTLHTFHELGFLHYPGNLDRSQLLYLQLVFIIKHSQCLTLPPLSFRSLWSWGCRFTRSSSIKDLHFTQSTTCVSLQSPSKFVRRSFPCSSRIHDISPVLIFCQNGHWEARITCWNRSKTYHCICLRALFRQLQRHPEGLWQDQQPFYQLAGNGGRRSIHAGLDLWSGLNERVQHGARSVRDFYSLYVSPIIGSPVTIAKVIRFRLLRRHSQPSKK